MSRLAAWGLRECLMPSLHLDPRKFVDRFRADQRHNIRIHHVAGAGVALAATFQHIEVICTRISDGVTSTSRRFAERQLSRNRKPFQRLLASLLEVQTEHTISGHVVVSRAQIVLNAPTI